MVSPLPHRDTSLEAQPLELARRQGRSSGARRLGAWAVANDLPSSFRYAAQGLAYSFLSQRNFRIHVGTGSLAFGLVGLSAYGTIGRLIMATVGAIILIALGRALRK